MVFVVLISALLGTAVGVSYEDADARILGGNETDIENYPYTLQLHYMDRLECGGILISNQFALTAAHCIHDKTMEYFVIRAGTTTLGEGGQTFTISEIIFHPQFDMSQDNYDAAVLLLSETVSISSARPIELAVDDSGIAEGATLLIAGWGWMRLNTNDQFSTKLRVTDLIVLGDEECKNSYSTLAITEAMFCANYSGTKIRDFCFGDYGGPAVIDGILQGVISFGESCGDGFHAKVFVRISKIREWVENVMESVF